MDIQKISNEIATLKRAVKTAATASLKDKLKKKVESLNQVLKDANIPAKKLAMMLLGAKRKVASYTTAEFNAVIKRLSYKAEYTFLKGLSKVEIKDDLERYAKNPGWRFKGKGNFKTPTKSDLINDMGKPTNRRKTYYESRSNRSDVTNPAKLATGGGVDNDMVYFTVDNDGADSLLQENFRNYIDYENLNSGDVLYKMDRRNFERFEDLATSTSVVYGDSIEEVNSDGSYMMETGGGLNYKAQNFLDTIRISDRSIQLKDITIEATPKGNWKVYHKGKSLMTVNGNLLNEETIDKYDLRHDEFAKGGGVQNENKEMVLNNAQQIEHHAEELENAAKKSKHVPAWVVAKVYNASSNISDATHYLEGVNTMPKEQFERIHEEIENYKMSDGGGLNSFMDKQMHISKVCKTHGCSSKDYLNAKKKYGIGGTLLLAGLGVAGLIAYNNSKNPMTEDEYKLKMYKKGTLQNTIIVDESYVNKATEDYKKLGYIVRVAKIKKMATGGGVEEKEGLYVTGRTREDNQKIDEMIDKEGLYAEFNVREGYWFFPEEKDMYDALEKQLENYFAEYGINARFEGIFAKGGPTKAQEKVGKVMHEFKEGTLHSGKSDKVVKNPKQAIAIALSEAGLSKNKGWKYKK